jgi:alpha 1,6-mannosyltransferase
VTSFGQFSNLVFSTTRTHTRHTFLRYLILFLKGGIYTDTDTTSVRPIEKWPGLWDGNTRNLADPVLQMLSAAAALSRSNRDASGDDGRAWAEARPPRLIVAIEADFITFNHLNWKAGDYARALQMCQVTFHFTLARETVACDC